MLGEVHFIFKVLWVHCLLPTIGRHICVNYVALSIPEQFFLSINTNDFQNTSYEVFLSFSESHGKENVSILEKFFPSININDFQNTSYEFFELFWITWKGKWVSKFVKC